MTIQRSINVKLLQVEKLEIRLKIDFLYFRELKHSEHLQLMLWLFREAARHNLTIVYGTRGSAIIVRMKIGNNALVSSEAAMANSYLQHHQKQLHSQVLIHLAITLSQKICYENSENQIKQRCNRKLNYDRHSVTFQRRREPKQPESTAKEVAPGDRRRVFSTSLSESASKRKIRN